MYYDPVARWLVRAYGTFTFVAALFLTGAHIATPWRVALAVFAFSWLWFSWGWLGSKMGVETRADGVRVSVGFRRRPAAWSEIKTFRVVNPTALSPSVRVELYSGQLLRTALVQGRKMRWKGGSSRDIAGVLNDELERTRAGR